MSIAARTQPGHGWGSAPHAAELDRGFVYPQAPPYQGATAVRAGSDRALRQAFGRDAQHLVGIALARERGDGPSPRRGAVAFGAFD